MGKIKSKRIPKKKRLLFKGGSFIDYNVKPTKPFNITARPPIL